nr:MAG TPA: cytosine DNA methyltransferase [Caudoviricetes sp.]
MAERPLYTLYKNLKAQNYDVPDDYNKFESALTRDGKGGADNRHAIYENLKAQNFDVPNTYERFYSALFEPRSKTSSRAKGGSVPMTAADRARFSAGAAAISASANNAVRQAKRNIQSKLGQAKKFNGGRVSPRLKNPLQNQNVQKNEFNYNSTTGKTGTYTTTDGVEFDNEYDAAQYQNQLDKQGEQYINAVNAGEIPSVFDVRDKNGNYDLQENINKNGTYLTEEGAQKQFDKKLADAYARKKEIEALIAEDHRQHGNPLLSYGASIGASNGRTAEQSDYSNKLATSLALVKQQIGALEAVKQYPTSSWGEDALKALDNTAFTAKTWDFGLTDFATMGQMERIKTKMDNNLPLSGSDKMLLKSKLGADAAAALEDEKMGNIYRWTKIAGQSLPFMADFFLTGGYGGITKAISRGALKFAAKRGMGKVSAAILKNTGIVAGDVIGSYAMAGSEQAMKTGADIMQRHLGSLYQDEKGDYKFGTFDENGNLLHEGGESMGTALYKGLTSAMVENYTEKLFGHSYGIKKGAINFMEKHGMNASAEFFKNIGKSGWYTNSKKWMEKFGINGFGEEVMEEEIGIPLHALLDGDNKFSDLLDTKQQLDIIGGMALSVGSMYAMGAGSRPVKGVYNRAQYYRFRNKVNVADSDAQNLIGDKWADIKDKIDNTTNEQMGGVLADILRQRDTMTKEQINAAINYGINLMKMRGYNVAKTAEMNAREITNEPTTPEEQHQEDIDNAYSEGHDADDADKHDIQLEHEDQMKTLAGLLNISEQQLSAMNDDELQSLTGQNDKLDQAIYDYQLSSARYQGVTDDAQDKIDMAANQAAQRVDMYTDKSRGSVRNATVKASGGAEDYGVYIISGNIATNEDGSINVADSDDMILFYDPTTNSVEHTDALRFAELGDEVPADDVKAQAVADAKEKAIKEVAGIVDGTIDVGSQFKVTGADGLEHTYEILADYGDGTAAISIDGNVVENPYSFEDLQQLKDLEDQKRLEAAKAQREQMEKERAEQQTQETEQPEETQPSLDFNQILNDNGNVVLVDVLDKDGNTKYPDSKLFLIRDTGAKAKVVEMKSDGTFVPHAVSKKNVATISSMSLDEYKQAMAETSMIEENSGAIEGDRGGIEVNDELPPVPDNVTINGDGTYSVDGAVQGGENTTAPVEQTEQTPAMTLEDGTIVPMLEDGNPDFSKLTADQTAELYDSQFGEDADSVISGWVSDAKKALDKANNMTVKGKNFVEQKAAKEAKEKAIADAQAAYDSAIAIRDAYNSRQLAKVEDDAEGRKNLIEKARRKFARLKSAVKDDAEVVSQLYKDIVGSLLHRLYDGTGIDVTDTIPLTAEEYVASNLGAHSLNYEGTETSKGVKQESGLSREDFAKTQLLAADGKGTTIDDLVHNLWENRPSNLESLDTQDIRNALIGVLTSGFKASEARNYIENLRIAQAENFLEEQKKAADNAAFAEENKAESEQQTETAPESEEKTGEDNSDEENEKINEQTNENINAPEVPEDATEENPLGAQRDQTDLPFSAKENGKQQTTAERAADVEKNKVDDMKVVDNIVGEKTRKAFERLAKMMGANIQWQYSDKLGNGWVQETTDADGNVHRTIFITLDSSITEGAQFIFGHEMTHQIKILNPAAYNELTQIVLDTYGSDAFDKAIDETMKRYSDAGFSGRARDYYAEEVVADAVGEMIRDLNLAHTLAMKMSHPLLAAIHEILQKIKLAFFGTEYSDVTKNIIRSIEQAYVKTAKGEVTNSETGEDVSFSLRQKPEPKKKGVGYKVFVLKDGKLYPPMVANPDGAATPVGVWLDADAAPIAGESKTGRPQVKQGGKGTQGGSGKLAYRPGWHLGVVPYAIQFNRKDAEGNKTLFPKNFVFAEVEYAADVDYQEEARQEGINPSGKYQHSLAGLKHLPTDGYYMYRTNPNPETDPWVITGAMKVNRILTRAEQAELVKNAGREPQQIQKGDIVTDDVVNSINQEIAAAPKFSLKVYHGSGADFTEFDFDHIGEGAGSQVFGWGGYVTSSKKIGKSYATLMDNDPSKAYYRIQRSNGTRFAKKYPTLESFLHGDKQIAMNDKFTEQEKIDFYNEMKKLAEPYHNLYEVDIPDDNGSNYLDWDKPLSKNQQDAIREGLEHLGVGIKTLESKGQSLERTGENVYNSTLYIGLTGTEYDLPERTKGISKFLSSVGFTGIKYKAGRNFGGAKKGDTNYVIFKPEDMRITEHTKFSLKSKPVRFEAGKKLSDEEKKEVLSTLKDAYKVNGVPYHIEETAGGKEKRVYEPTADSYGMVDNLIDGMINTKVGAAEIKPVGVGAFGNIYNQFRGKAKAAIEFLKKLGSGEATAALHHHTIGDISLVWGDKKTGLDKILRKHPEVVDNLQSIIDSMEVVQESDNRVKLESPTHFAVVSKEYKGEPREQWLLTAYEKRESLENGKSMDTATSSLGGDTALSQSKESAAKIDNSSETAKENGEKFSLKDEKIKSVAEKFGVNEDDVAMYANAVERGSTAEAARARANIKRYLLQANEDKISSFKDIIKYTKPINEALKENFGDLDAMIEERRKQVEAQRNAMEAARKRAQEEEEKRQKHLDELSLIPTDELDKRYMDAIANNDESTAREMLDESARRNGYGDVDSDYQGQGAWAAPSNPQYDSDEARRADIENSPDVNLEDIALGYNLQPDDYFDNPRAYMNNTAYGLESAHVIKNALDAIKNGEKDVKVKVYRAVPTSVKEGKLRNGDWVTPSKKYAEMHGDNRLDGKYRIIEDEVPANQLWWDGNDVNEFGFDDGKEYRYKNAKNNRKLNDLITYDNKGNVIPPSKRFNSRKSDIRFSLKEEMEKIVADAKANGTYMTAPNGEKTKLDAEQWATVRTANFKNWFGDWENDPENASKVVDENGEPMVVWHGRSAEFNTFEKKEGVRFIMGLEDKVKAEGFFFSPDKGLAEEFASNSSRHRGGKANVVPCFLNIRRPMDLTGEDYDRIYEDVTGWEYMVGMDTQDNLWGIMDEEGMADKIKEKGYDGAIFVEEVDDSYEPTKISYCALDSNQIKSAENNNGDFSADNNDIRFSLKSMMTKPEGWKQANKKAIHIEEAIERDPKFSLKNLDGTLIKAGTYFSGGGLVEEGLKGIIDPVVAVEYDEKISGVYRNNFGQHIVTADVRDVDPRELVKQIDGEVEYFHASPVCKNYSQAKSNHAEVELDKETAASTAEFINAVKPKVVTIENVKGYKDSEAMKIITDALDANGYTWDADVYNAADYGGYTNRERLIVRAVRDGKLPAKPKKMAHKSGWYEAVADIIQTLTEKKNGVAPWMDVRLKADGIDWRNIDKPLYVMGSAYADGKVPHAFADELLPTLRTKSGDVIVMPDGKVYRAMGRVLARVSGVSDDYKMPFSENLSHTIIGNGIPTQLTEHVIAPLLTGSDPKFSLKKINNVKDSRIIPTDVDKSVSSQIEKKYDSAIKEVMNKVAERDKRLVSNYIEQDLSDFSKMRREDINQELKSNENWRRKNLREENREGSTYGITDARHRITEATAERELEYRDVRAKYLSETYGLQGGRQTSLDMVDRAFEDTLGNETNRGELRELYGKARKILVQVGAEFGGVDNAKQEGDLGFAGTDRDISLFIDTMTRTSTPQSELAHTILHEMIHQATIGSINLVKKGMADGMLTPKQIEAVNTIINTYDAYKADRRLVWEEDNYRDYGGKDEYEFAAEMADAKQRRILSIPYGERILNAANELKRVGDISLWQAIKNALRRLFEVSDKSKMDKALSDIMDDLNENIDDISMNNIEETDFGLNGNTRFSLRYDKFEHDLNQWKKDNNLPKDAQRPTIPQRNAGESAVDFLRRVDEYRKQMSLWKTAPTYEQHLLSDDTALGEFNRELQRGSVLKRIAFQDSMLAIRKAQEAIMKEVGVDRLNMAEDAYTAENRSHGKGKNEFEEYNNEFLQPLRKAYHQMKKVLGDSYDNVRVYMMAKHGLERDAQMAFKKSLEADYEDVNQRSAAYKAYKNDLDRVSNDADLEFGRVDFTTWRQKDNALRGKYSPSYMDYRYDDNGIAYDYSGLSSLFDGSDFEEAAHRLVRDVETKHLAEVQALWNATNAATKKILRDGLKAGMMSKDSYEYVKGMYSHYIPLRGWDGTTADQVWDYIGGGKGAFNQTLKTAHGRTSIADDPIAYIENMAESGILLNNKNWVKQHLMLLAQNHPTSLLTLSKAWYVKSTDANGNEEWIPATPQITSQMNSNQVKAAIDAFEQKMEQLAQTGDATQQRDGLNIAYPQTHSEEREHEVRVMKDGEEYVIYVNGDPQLAQAMNNTRAHRVREIQSGKLDRAAAWLGRKMAAAYTSLSPLFIPSNYFRDLTMTLASTAIREDGRYNYLLRKNLATSWNLGFMLRDYQNGKLREKVNNGNATAKEQMFYDFMMNGGETGFVSSLDVEDLKKKFKNDLKDLDRWKANPVKVGHTIMDSIEFLNRMIEDSNRFAVYMTSIQYGRSIDEAVNDAKDVTLNFNRKGTGEYGWQMIRNLYLFINPAVQSLQTLGALTKHHPFKFTAVTAAWLASGVLVPIVNAALMSLFGGDDDKDKYWQFSKWDRRNNAIMWIPFTNEYVKIPLAQEFRAFYGIGDMIASKMMGGELAEETWSQYAEDLLGQVVDMLPLDPTGYDGNIAVSLMPNPIRPVFELAFNVDFTGKPLFKETEYNKYDPNFTKAYVGTPDWLVRVSKMVNSIGNDYPDVQQNAIDAFGDPRYNLNNPAVVDHVLSSYLGGAYTMGSQVLGVLTKSLNDPKEIKMADIPLVSKFVSNPDDRPVTKKQGDEFWNMKENHDRAANTLSKLKKQAKVDGDYSMLERFYGSEEYKQYKQEDVKVKKYEEDKKKERAEESGEEYRSHKLNAEDIYKAHATPKDDFEDLKLKQLFTKLNGFKTSYDLLVDTAPGQSDGYYNTNKVAIDAIDEISLDKQEISELKKGFLEDGKDAYNSEDMKRIRELRKRILSVLEPANKVVVVNQKAKAEKK